MIKKLKDRDFREAFVSSNARRGIAYQLRALRGARTQAQIGKLLGKPQNVVSRLEDPSYGKVTIQTLLEVAAAYDVALLVKFVSYGRLVAELENLSNESLAPLSYDAEQKLLTHKAVGVYGGETSVTHPIWQARPLMTPTAAPSVPCGQQQYMPQATLN